MSSSKSFKDVFTTKYNDFCEDLRGACPELESKILVAKRLSFDERIVKFKEQVLPNAGPMRDAEKCPGFILPDVEITETIWTDLSKTSKDAIQQHLTVLSFITLYNIHKEDKEENKDNSANDMKEWAEKFMNEWKTKMGGIDFESISKKLLETFTSSSSGNFKLPEKFLRGNIARIAEEIVSEFKPEDFGFDAATLERLEREPGSAMELLMNIYTNKPELIQGAMKRIIKRLQEKFQNGTLHPEQIAAEAEELMKEFSGNTNFVELMETFRNTFGMADMEQARKNNREQSARSNIVRERLKKKLEKKKSGSK